MFYQVPSWLFYMNVWNVVTISAYVLAFALFESSGSVRVPGFNLPGVTSAVLQRPFRRPGQRLDGHLRRRRLPASTKNWADLQAEYLATDRLPDHRPGFAAIVELPIRFHFRAFRANSTPDKRVYRMDDRVRLYLPAPGSSGAGRGIGAQPLLGAPLN